MIPSPRSRPRPRADEDARDGPEHRWLIGVWVVVALFGVVTAIWSSHVGVPLRDPGGRIFTNRLVIAVGLLAVLAVVDACVRQSRNGWTFRGAMSRLRARWTVDRVALAVSGLLAYHIVYVCYRNLKSWDAFNRPRDDELLRLDKWLFLGHSPATLLHDLLGQHAVAQPLALVYESFTYLAPLSVVAALVFVRQIRDAYVFLLSGIWVWILGVGSYYLIPSLGPFASASSEFAGLSQTGITSIQTTFLTERAHLLQHPEAGDAFASISAFASLHVGFTCMIVLMLRFYGWRLATMVMSAYLAVVMVATVYFGWHFVVDDVAGILLAILAVFLGRLLIYPSGRPRSEELELDLGEERLGEPFELRPAEPDRVPDVELAD